MPDVNETLNERQKTHGDFGHHAEIAQDLKNVMHRVNGWNRLTPVQKEALEMIQHKVARILNGNPNVQDHWHDIGGYAKLAEDRCCMPAQAYKDNTK